MERTTKQIYALAFTAFVLIALTFWLTARQGGIGGPLASLPGTVFFALMLSCIGVVSTLTCKIGCRISTELLVYLVATILISSLIVFAGFGLSPFIPVAATFAVMFLVQTFVVSTVRPIIQSKDRRIQFSLRHVFYVTFGVAILASSFTAIAPISVAILTGLVFGGLTVGAYLTACHSRKLGVGVSFLALVASFFLPSVKVLPNGDLGMLPLAILTLTALILGFAIIIGNATPVNPDAQIAG